MIHAYLGGTMPSVEACSTWEDMVRTYYLKWGTSQYLLGRESHVHILGSNLGKWSFHLTPYIKKMWKKASSLHGVMKFKVYNMNVQSSFHGITPTCRFFTNGCGLRSVGKLTEWIILSPCFVTSSLRAYRVWSSKWKPIQLMHMFVGTRGLLVLQLQSLLKTCLHKIMQYWSIICSYYERKSIIRGKYATGRVKTQDVSTAEETGFYSSCCVFCSYNWLSFISWCNNEPLQHHVVSSYINQYLPMWN